MISEYFSTIYYVLCNLFNTKDLKLRKTDLWTQRYESLTPNMKDLHPKTETSKDVCYKDIALRDIVPWDKKTLKTSLMFSWSWSRRAVLFYEAFNIHHWQSSNGRGESQWTKKSRLLKLDGDWPIGSNRNLVLYMHSSTILLSASMALYHNLYFF